MKTAIAIADVFTDLIASMETPAMRWLRTLPEYDCPACGKKTIFKSGCSEHEDEDPSPWCSACGAKTPDKCPCGPIAEND